MPEEENKNQKYSSGLNIVIRLDELWKDTHKHSRAGQYEKWNSDLDRIWLELARDLYKINSEEEKDTQTEFNKIKKLYDAIEQALEKLGSFDDYKGDSFEPIAQETIKKRNDQYKKLMEKQLFLAGLENQLGKGTTFEEDEEGWD